MTREEAIERIKDHMEVHRSAEPRAIYITEALKMAIKALEQESCETQMIDKSNFSQEQYKADLQSAYDCGKASVKPCEDTISRADAIRVASGYCHPANIAKELAKLPPVTPKPKADVLNKIRAEIEKLQTYKMFVGEKTVYVERDDVLEIIDKYKRESEE